MRRFFDEELKLTSSKMPPTLGSAAVHSFKKICAGSGYDIDALLG